MQLKNLNVTFFFLLFFGVGVVVFLVFQPFITAMIAAAVLAAILKKPYHLFERWFHGHRVASALLTCLLAIVVIVTPLAIVTTLGINEFSKLSDQLDTPQGAQGFLDGISAKAETVPIVKDFVNTRTFSKEKIRADIEGLSSNVFAFAQQAYISITSFILWIFVLFFTLFYFLIDGKRALRYLMNLSPLRNEHDKLLIEKFVSISRATLKGTLVVGIVQSVLAGIAFAIVGIPSPVIWTVIMLLFSVIPMIGTAAIWLPAGLILLALGEVWKGVFILGFGSFVISTIDNILRPRLVGKDTQMHPLLIFFATIGGIAFFGLPGFVMGPIIIALFFALSQIYQIEFSTQLKEYNEPHEPLSMESGP